VWRIQDVYPGSRILIFTHPGSRIPDPKTVTEERGEKIFFIIFFCSHKFQKNEYYVIFEMLKRKILANFQRIVLFLPKKFSPCSQIYLGSWIEVKKSPDPGYGSATLVRGMYPDPAPDPSIIMQKCQEKP
jgi:hypothetical protein